MAAIEGDEDAVGEEEEWSLSAFTLFSEEVEEPRPCEFDNPSPRRRLPLGVCPFPFPLERIKYSSYACRVHRQ